MCIRVIRGWRSITANNANPREWGTGVAPLCENHVSHKGTKTQRDKDSEKALCAFVSLCENHVSHKGTKTQRDKDSEKALCAFVSLCEPPAAVETRPTNCNRESRQSTRMGNGAWHFWGLFSIRVHSCYSWMASVQTCDAPRRCVAGGTAQRA